MALTRNYRRLCRPLKAGLISASGCDPKSSVWRMASFVVPFAPLKAMVSTVKILKGEINTFLFCFSLQIAANSRKAKLFVLLTVLLSWMGGRGFFGDSSGWGVGFAVLSGFYLSGDLQYHFGRKLKPCYRPIPPGLIYEYLVMA